VSLPLKILKTTDPQGSGEGKNSALSDNMNVPRRVGSDKLKACNVMGVDKGQESDNV